MKKEYTGITYKKIDYSNKRELTLDLLKQIYEINELINKDIIPFHRYATALQTKLGNEKNNPECFYLAFKNNELISGIEGYFTTKDHFHINHGFTRKEYQRTGVGTKILIRTVADLRVHHNVKTIDAVIHSDGFNIVTKKITGLYPINKEKTIYRINKSNKFKYEFKSEPEIGTTHKRNTITVNKNKVSRFELIKKLFKGKRK